MSLMGLYRYWRFLSNRFEYILNICVSNIQFDTFRSLVGKEETEGQKEREKERSIVKFAYYYFLSFTMSFVRKWTFFFALRVRTYVYMYSVELREHRSNSIVLYIFVISYFFHICYTISLSLQWPLSKKRKKGEEMI
jgi:hypothetical protein